MKPAPIEPLSPELGALLEGERRAGPVPRSVQDEAWERVAAALAGGAVAPKAAAARRGWSARKGLVTATLGLCVGMALGAWLHAMLAKPVVEVREVAAPQASAAASSAPEPIASPSAQPPPPAPPPASSSITRSPSQPFAAASSRPDALAQERTLLDRARSALARGDVAAARAALAEHEHTFARGMLAEEREFLAIQCALREGNAGEARERAARFRARFPGSALQPAIDQSLGGTSNP